MSGSQLRAKEVPMWFAVGAPVWYVVPGNAADRPAEVVAVLNDKPGYAIRFHYETEPRHTESHFLRHPMHVVAPVLVHVEARCSRTVWVPLDGTPATNLSNY